MGRKSAQVMQGAWSVFLQHGYAGASVDDIARAADVSKATLYAYFPDKRVLFRAVIQSVLEDDGIRPLAGIDMEMPAENALPRMTAAMTGWLRSEKETNLYRLAVGEANRFPDLAERYQDRIETKLVHPLRERLATFVARGEIDIDDIPLATRQLIGLCGLTFHDRAMTSSSTSPQSPVKRMAATAATMFLRAYASVPSDRGVAHFGQRESGA